MNSAGPGTRLLQDWIRYWMRISARRRPKPYRVFGAASLGRFLMDTITYSAVTGSASGMVRSGEVKLLVPTCLAPSIDGRSLVKTLMLPPDPPSWLRVIEETLDGSFSL